MACGGPEPRHSIWHTSRAEGWTCFWEFHLKPWDMAAGILMIQEAGGACTDMRGGPVDLLGPHVLGDNGLVHEETVALFAEIFAGK